MVSYDDRSLSVVSCFGDVRQGKLGQLLVLIKRPRTQRVIKSRA